jgi:hypothetical protein
MINKHLMATVFALISFGGLAHASTITGSIWENDPTGAGNATVANVPVGPADVTFSVSSPSSPLNFSSTSLTYTIGDFLTSGGASVLTGGGELGKTLNNTIFNFTGLVTVTTGQSFTVGHDDGLTLVIGGNTIIDLPGPHSPGDDTVTYSGPTGTFAFQLVYGEAFGAPAELSVSLPLVDGVPEPSTWAMMILGFMGVGFMAYRRKGRSTFRFA